MTPRVKAAMAALRLARRELCEALAADYPLGADVAWFGPAGRHTGTVLRHGTVGDLEVAPASGAGPRWIAAGDLAPSPTATGEPHGTPQA